MALQATSTRYDDPVSKVLEQMGSGHTRYPVVASSSDDLRGVVHLHDLLDQPAGGTAQSRSRGGVVVPTTLPLPGVLAQLSKVKDEMALDTAADTCGCWSAAIPASTASSTCATACKRRPPSPLGS